MEKKYDIFVKETEIETRDYRLRWGSEDPGDIKPMVRKKYFKGMIPDATGRLAYQRARKQFEREEYSLDEFE